MLYGKIVSLYNPKEPNPKCAKCQGWAKDKPIIGLMFAWGLKKAQTLGKAVKLQIQKMEKLTLPKFGEKAVNLK